MKKESTNQIFQPLMDWWVAGLVLLLIALFSAAIPVFIAGAFPTWEMVVIVLFIVMLILYIADIAFFSYYQLDEKGLTIVSQMRHIVFPYRNIIEVKPGNISGLFSFGGKKRFALSARCYVIRLQHEEWKAITVSPVAKDQFLNHLLEHIDQERSSRATIERRKK